MSTNEARPISCLEAEELLFERSPAEVERAAAGQAEPELCAHLGSCESCAALASDLSALTPLAQLPTFSPTPALVEATLALAGAEARQLAAARRSAAVRAGLKAAGAFLVCLPLIAGFNAGVAYLGSAYLPDLLPEGALLYLGGVFGLGVLAALSALVFLLTLIAGAATRPPREDLLLEA